MSFDMSKIYQIIDNIGQFVASNRGVIEEPIELVTFNVSIFDFFQ